MGKEEREKKGVKNREREGGNKKNEEWTVRKWNEEREGEGKERM